MPFDIGSILAKIDADISGFQKGMADAKRSADGFGSNLKSVGDSIADFGKQSAIMAGVVGAGLTVAGKMALDYAGKYEQYQIAFTTLLKDEKKAGEAILQIQKDAAATPFEMAPLIMGNQRLISAGVSAKQARVDIINLGNAISATGGGNAELERLSTNLQQIKAVGKASALDIKQFAFAGINVYQMLANSMGKNVEQIKSMDISYDDLTKAFAKASEKGGMFEGAMAKQSQTLNGLISTLKDTVNIALKDILMKSGIFDALREGVANLIPMLQNGAVHITRFFSVLGNAVSYLGSIIRGENVIDEVREMLSYFMGGEMPSENHPAVRFFYAFAEAIKNIGDWIAKNQETVMAFLQGLAIAFGALMVIGTITALIMALTNPLVMASLAIAALYTAWQTNFLGIRDITMAVINAIVTFFNEILMPAISVLVEFFRANWTDIQLIVTTAWEIIKAVIEVAVGLIWGIISTFVLALVAFLKEYWGVISENVKYTWNLIKGIIQVALAVILAIVAVFIGLLTGNWDRAHAMILKASETAFAGVKNILNGVWGFISSWGGRVLSALVSPFEDAWRRIEGLMNKIRDALDFTKRHSPSVVDIINKGVREVNRAMDGLTFSTNLTPQAAAMTVSNGGQSTMVNDIHIDMNGAYIGDEFAASKMGEKIGDSIIKKLQLNVRF